MRGDLGLLATYINAYTTHIRGIRGLCVLEKIMKIMVTYFFFLSPFIYYLLLVVRVEKEWMMEKRQGYFQTQLLFPCQQLFRAGNVFPEPEKKRPPSWSVYMNLRKSFFLASGSSSFQACVDSLFCLRPRKRLLFFVFIYSILCLSYFYLIFYVLSVFIHYCISTHILQPRKERQNHEIHCLILGFTGHSFPTSASVRLVSVIT